MTIKKIITWCDPAKFYLLTHQCIFLFLALGCMAFFLYRPITEFHPLGEHPRIYEIPQETFNAPKASQPAIVTTGLSITDFIKFDIIKNEFIANLVVWFEFDPQKISLERLSKFTFSQGHITKKADPIITHLDGMEQAVFFVETRITSMLDYTRFPLDDHYIFLLLTHESLTIDDLVFVTDETRFAINQEELSISGWEVVKKSARSGYEALELSPQITVQVPKALFAVGVSKKDVRQLLLIFLPLLFIFCLGIFSFAIEDATIAITLAVGSISGLLAYSFVIQTLSPAVGYFMLSDELFIFFLATAFIVFLLSCIFAAREYIVSPTLFARLKGALVACAYIMLVAAWYYLTNVKNFV